MSTTLKVTLNYLEYESQVYRFVHILDVAGTIWFAGKTIVEMLQNNSKNTDRVVNRLDMCFKAPLQDIVNDLEISEPLPKCLQKQSIMINIEGVKKMIDENTVATEAKKAWIKEKIAIIEGGGDLKSSIENTKVVEEIVPNKLQVKSMQFGDKMFEFIIIYDNNMELWMYGRPIAEYLEYANISQTLLMLNSSYIRKYNDFVSNVKSSMNIINLTLRNINSSSIFINQTGLFELVTKSKMPKAKEFQQWIKVQMTSKLVLNNIEEEVIPNKLQLKNVQFGNKLFEFIVIYDNNMELWMYGRPIAEYLEYFNAGQAVLMVNSLNTRKYKDFVSGSRVFFLKENLELCLQNIKSSSIFINQAGLFELMNKSTMPKAKEFQHWVNSDVLPKLTKNKVYHMSEAPIEQQQQLESINSLVNELKDRDELNNLKIELLQSKLDSTKREVKWQEELRKREAETREELRKREAETLEKRIIETQKYTHAMIIQQQTSSRQIQKIMQEQNTILEKIAVDRNTKFNLCKEMFITHASEVPKELGAYPVLEVYIVPTDCLPDEYNHLYGYTCSRVQKKQCGKKAKLNEYERLYITHSPNAINAWRCVKDRLKAVQESILKHNKLTFDQNEWLTKVTCINKGNTVYCNLDRNMMLNLLKGRSYGFEQDKPILADILESRPILKNSLVPQLPILNNN